ncbi:NAD(P)-binding protein [Pseudovirgaria hyperparasitica]|uniref:NAD(P)-binding protein n=1 Tax=Pseudovirgaria hyperparasitica TaxID=470096 RepID=A0A6A6VV03_9PEZI|nr:NAD(P)-binding protein [Pseudovirgaria hyperparasitica]KAF2753450.1 NAD(P)-binding protein [Pseudovirgaria hyperparasitica]
MTNLQSRPSRSLASKVAIVTGAGSAGEGIGNGRAAALLLAEDGCHVVCVDINTEWADKTVEMIQNEGFAEAATCSGDVSNPDDCSRIVQFATEKFGRLDILINNVGVVGAKGTAIDLDLNEWNRGFEVNVNSIMLMSKYAIPVMMKNDRDRDVRGSIVNIGSVAGLRGGTPHLLYPTTKGAVVNMTRAMAAHHAPDGIRVNCVCPGMLYTPMMYGNGMSDEARVARKERSLLKTEGCGWDCGSAVRFLAGPEARWITGTILTVDAGTTACTSTNMAKGATV